MTRAIALNQPQWTSLSLSFNSLFCASRTPLKSYLISPLLCSTMAAVEPTKQSTLQSLRNWGGSFPAYMRSHVLALHPMSN
jgi:hypothetical protein